MSLAEAARRLAGQAVQVMLPMEACSWLRSDTWPGRRPPGIQALAYSIEEQVADDLENLHLAPGNPDSARRYPLLVIDKASFAGIVELLREVGLQVTSVQVDADLLPTDRPYVAWWGGRWLLGGAMEARLAVSEPLLQPLSSRLPEGICRLDHPQLAQVRALLTAGEGIDLLQGVFRQPPGRRPWRALSAALLAVFILSWGFTQARSQYLEHRAARLYEQSVRQFQALYPQEVRIVDLSAQLKRLNAGEAQRSRQMARLVHLVEQVIGGSGVELQRIDYQAGVGWTLALTADDFSELERLRERGRQNGLPIRLGAASKERNRVRATLILEEQNG